MNEDGGGYRVLAGSCGAATPLVEGSDGAFYGTTPDGGDLGGGAVFRLQSAPEISLALTPQGPCVRFAGQRGRNYEIQRAPAVTGQWNTIAVRVAPQDNLVEYTDIVAPQSAAYYRVRRVP